MNPSVSIHDPACPALATAVEIGRMLGYSADHIRRMAKRDAAFGRCRVVRPGAQARYSTKAVREWLEAPKPPTISRFDRILAEYAEASSDPVGGSVSRRA